MIEIFYEDSQCGPVQGVSAAQKLINVNQVDAIVGAVRSSVTLAIAPIIEQNQVVLISPASTSPKITNAGDYIFRVVPSDALRGKIFAEYIRNDVNLEKVTILAINNEAGLGNKDSFQKRFEELGGKIILTELYEQKAKDVKTQLIKINNKNPQAIVVVSYPEDSILVLKQVKELGISVPLYFQTEALDNISVIKAAGDTAEEVVYILPAESSGNVVEKFKESFKNKFNKEPALYAAEGCDAFNLLIESIKKCGENFDPICFKNKLYKIENYQGASGIITFDNNGDVLKPMAIKKIISGEKIIIKTQIIVQNGQFVFYE